MSTQTSTAAAAIRVLVVDDQPLMRMGSTLVLDAAEGLEVVGEAGSGEEAIRNSRDLKPDVVLMDVRMPGIGGIEATRIITATCPETKVIVLTTFDIDEYAFGGLEAGASAFLLKSIAPDRLVDAVRTVAAGEAVVEPRITKHLIDHYTQGQKTTREQNPGAPTVPAGQEPLDRLSPREHEVFLAIAAGLSNPEISEALHLSPATIKTHINRIFAKLNLRDRVHAVILAYELQKP